MEVSWRLNFKIYKKCFEKIQKYCLKNITLTADVRDFVGLVHLHLAGNQHGHGPEGAPGPGHGQQRHGHGHWNRKQGHGHKKQGHRHEKQGHGHRDGHGHGQGHGGKVEFTGKWKTYNVQSYKLAR